jgi:hypothetical protein
MRVKCARETLAAASSRLANADLRLSDLTVGLCRVRESMDPIHWAVIMRAFARVVVHAHRKLSARRRQYEQAKRALAAAEELAAQHRLPAAEAPE